jgi:hypothetical protein
VEFPHSGGGINFVPALESAEMCMRNTPEGVAQHIVFMTGGEASDLRAACTRVASMAQRGSAGFEFHAVSCGSASTSSVQALLNAAGRAGKFRESSYTDLEHTFVSVAATTAANTHLYETIGRKIVEAVEDKIVLDVL